VNKKKAATAIKQQRPKFRDDGKESSGVFGCRGRIGVEAVIVAYEGVAGYLECIAKPGQPL